MIALQHVSLFWTKWERGAQNGAIRNQIPRKWPFIPPGDPTLDWVHHRHLQTDRRGKYQPREQWIQRRAQSEDGIITRIRGDVCEVSFAGAYQGKLHRPHFHGLIAKLPFGQMVTIQVNGASDGDHQRYYFEDTFHVAFTETATLDLPLYRLIDERKLLY